MILLGRRECDWRFSEREQQSFVGVVLGYILAVVEELMFASSILRRESCKICQGPSLDAR